MKEKLLKIIYNHIDNAKNIKIYNCSTSDALPDIKIYRKQTYTRFVNNAKLTVDSDPSMFIDPYEYSCEIPKDIKEKQKEEAVNEYIKLIFNNEPPILVNMVYDHVTKQKPITLIKNKIGDPVEKKPRTFNLFNLFKQNTPEPPTKNNLDDNLNATLTFIELIPLYKITCGPIVELIDEQTFLDIKNKIIDKNKSISNKQKIDSLNKTKEIIEQRLNQIK